MQSESFQRNVGFGDFSTLSRTRPPISRQHRACPRLEGVSGPGSPTGCQSFVGTVSQGIGARDHIVSRIAPIEAELDRLIRAGDYPRPPASLLALLKDCDFGMSERA
jgi:hypothetical protein